MTATVSHASYDVNLGDFEDYANDGKKKRRRKKKKVMTAIEETEVIHSSIQLSIYLTFSADNGRVRFQ